MHCSFSCFTLLFYHIFIYIKIHKHRNQKAELTHLPFRIFFFLNGESRYISDTIDTAVVGHQTPFFKTRSVNSDSQ